MSAADGKLPDRTRRCRFGLPPCCHLSSTHVGRPAGTSPVARGGSQGGDSWHLRGASPRQPAVLCCVPGNAGHASEEELWAWPACAFFARGLPLPLWQAVAETGLLGGAGGKGGVGTAAASDEVCLLQGCHRALTVWMSCSSWFIITCCPRGRLGMESVLVYAGCLCLLPARLEVPIVAVCFGRRACKLLVARVAGPFVSLIRTDSPLSDMW